MPLPGVDPARAEAEKLVALVMRLPKPLRARVMQLVAALAKP